MPHERCLITGATGLIGRYLVEALLDAGERVRVLTRGQRAIDPAWAGRVEIAKGDLTDAASLPPALDGCDRLFHLAGELRNPDRLWSVNADGTRALLDEAQRAGVRHLVHMSSVGVIGAERSGVVDETETCHPRNPYEESKLAAERAARAWGEQPGRRAIALRPTIVFGPRSANEDDSFLQLLKAIQAGRFVHLDRRAVANYVYVEDVVAACVAAMQQDAAGVLIVADPSPLEAFVRAAADALQVSAPTRRLPSVGRARGRRRIAGVEQGARPRQPAHAGAHPRVVESHAVRAGAGTGVRLATRDWLSRRPGSHRCRVSRRGPSVAMPPRICRVVTVPMTFTTLLRDQIQRIRDASLDLTLVCSPGDDLTKLSRDLSIRALPLPMARAISPLSDTRALAALTVLFRRERFDLVHSSTPKAGLITALAGRLSGIKRRLHTFTGQPWVEMHGAARRMAREADRLIGRLNTDLYTDSHSQRDFLLSEGVGTADRLHVIGDGSISGVDVRRFDPDALAGARAEVRGRLGIAADALVIVFVGRLTRDKGARELIEAFVDLASRHARLELLLVGPEEPERDPLPSVVRRQIATNARIHRGRLLGGARAISRGSGPVLSSQLSRGVRLGGHRSGRDATAERRHPRYRAGRCRRRERNRAPRSGEASRATCGGTRAPHHRRRSEGSFRPGRARARHHQVRCRRGEWGSGRRVQAAVAGVMLSRHAFS